MKLKFLALMALVLLISATVFAGGPNVKRTTKPYGLVATGVAADIFTIEVVDTVVRAAANSDTCSNLILASVPIEPEKYIGWECFWQILAIESDSIVRGDTCFPLLWTSEDGSNWYSVLASTAATTGITGDTMTVGASGTAANFVTLASYARRSRTTDFAGTPFLGRYLKVGMRYAGDNGAAFRKACKWRFTLKKLKG